MPGFTAWAGLTQNGLPKAGETVCVVAATGPVGGTVGQIARLMRCHVVRIAGGPEKCAHAVALQGFDACIDHKSADFADELKAATPKGIDVYFENVGGAVFDAVLPLLNTGARIPVCGLILQYNATRLPDGPDRLPWLMGQIMRKRITLRGNIIFQDLGHLYPIFAKTKRDWLAADQIRYHDDVVDGLDQAPQAFIGLLRGENCGKRVIRVGPVTTRGSSAP
jgi:NADPH-dependent curcumin reductase CurA